MTAKGDRELLTQDWNTSPRKHNVVVETNLTIPLSDGITLDADVTRPDTNDPVPVLLSAHAYPKEDQYTDLIPTGFSHTRGHMEAGDGHFFARRGYIHIVVNVRGTGLSGGTYDNLGERTILDICEAIEWLAEQEWCDGNVGMFGMSFFAIVQNMVAAKNPPALKAIFAPFAYTDMYRDRYYHGGILSHGFMKMWLPTLADPKLAPLLQQEIGDAAFQELVDAAKADPDIMAVPFLSEALEAPLEERFALIAEILAQPLDNDYYRDRSLDYTEKPAVPAYLGACWGVFGLHLPGAFRSWENWAGPKCLTIGPPLYLDRPIYQYQYESLRWFDHWLKGQETGLDVENPVRVFIDGTGDWKEGDSWPFPETRWTPFYLHNDGWLNEHELFEHDDTTSFEDAQGDHGDVQFWTGGMVEKTEICGPMVLNLYAETTADEVLWFISILHQDKDGNESLLTRGWLRGSQRELDRDKSLPWQPYYKHTSRTPVTPGEVVEYAIEIRPYGIELQPDESLGLRIKCADDEIPGNLLHAISMGHLSRQESSRITVHHSREYPSNLVLPITKGNRIGTYYSGGVLPSL